MDIYEDVRLRKKRAYPLWEAAYRKSMAAMEKAQEGSREERDRKRKSYEWEMGRAINAYFKMMDCRGRDLRMDEEGDK